MNNCSSFNNVFFVPLSRLLQALFLVISFSLIITSNVNTFALNNDLILNLPFPLGETYLLDGGSHDFSVDCFNSGFNRFSDACRNHRTGWGALDFTTNKGTGEVSAMASGTIVSKTPCQIIINHGFGYETRYYHLTESYVTEGQYVKVGQKIGAYKYFRCGVGDGKHLHASIWRDKKELNIYDFRIGNYYPKEGYAKYEGCLVHINGTNYCPGNAGTQSKAWLKNDEIVGSGKNTITKLIRRKNSSQCLNIHKPANNTRLDTWACDQKDEDQRMLFEEIGSNQFLLKRIGFCVNTRNPVTGKKVVVWKCDENDIDQKWIWQDNLIKRVDSDQCLNIYAPKSGKAVNTWKCDKNDIDQQWELI
jgi:murein DD-endopeptidase MepM/ murein hydrolase activator NlpD